MSTILYSETMHNSSTHENINITLLGAVHLFCGGASCV